MFPKLKKIILIITLLCFVSVGLLVAAPQPAKAQLSVVTAPIIEGFIGAGQVKQSISKVLMQVGVTATFNAVTYFFQKMAADAATYIASGGAGQKPLFDNKSFSDYIKDTSLNSAMVGITELSDKTLGSLGFDVCSPQFPSLLNRIKLGLPSINVLYPQTPRCVWSDFKKNWEEFRSSMDGNTVLKNFGVMFEPGNSELSIALEINSRTIAKIQYDTQVALAEKTKNGPWKDVKDIITGKVKTPAETVGMVFEKDIADAKKNKQKSNQDLWNSALAAGAEQMLPTIISTFATTLLSAGLEKITNQVFTLPLDDEDENQQANLLNATSPVSPAVGRRVAEKVFNAFLVPKIVTTSNYDPLLEFTACPDNEGEKQINNCVLDDGFAAAVRLADQGSPLTIADALSQGSLDGNKPLISSKDARNEQKDCYQQGYCYSNLVKLRKARILPVGFELAADLDTGSGGRAPNLKTVVDGFYNCNAVTGARDASHPYCHLIDPNWVLRLPKTQCKATVYGPTLASTAGSFRAQTCANPISCISQDENGNCTGGWGYCTKEKNIWRISADTCSEQFNTCLTYKARDKKQYNYLQNTTDYGSCSSENVGCRAYAVTQKSNLWSIAQGDAVYFNKDIEKCDAKNAGCSELYSKADGLAYNLLPNPSFEKNATIPVSGWIGAATLKISTDGTNSFDGQNAVNPTGNLFMASPAVINLAPNTAYAFSGYVKKPASGSHRYRLAMFLYTDSSAASASLFNPANIISTCKIGTDSAMEISGDAAASYSRVSCAFLTPGLALYARPFLGGTAWIDAVQMEEGSSATAFLSSGYGTVTSVFAKVAPDYLDCDAGVNDSRCQNYAPSCKINEVGCELYTPKDGSPAIAGWVSIDDICPASCNGYETYRQEKTIYETEKFPSFLIAATAKTCNAADAGCDEFTNLSTEAEEYFSNIRQCIKLTPKDWDAFYTWEGSDQTGYQLRAHRLKIGVAQVGETGPVPAITDNNYAACDKTIFTAPFADPKYNSDCREFYNTAGQISYRLLSKTIIATDDCVDYRKTESGQSDCASSGGEWNDTAQYCLYRGYKTESRVCAATANKCRAYSGAAASNLRIVFQDDFEGGRGWIGGAVSSESLSAGGHSYKGSSGAGINKSLTGQVSAASSYSISFWAKGNGGEAMQVSMSSAAHGAGSAAFLAITLKGDWQYYELGPINTNQTISSAPTLIIRLASGAGFYIDNIILKEASQKLYLIKDSWATPAICDQTLKGALLPQAMLGCKEYTTSANESVYLKSFSSLCRAEAVGCAAFQQTYNSAAEYGEYFNLICSLPNLLGGDCTYNKTTVCSIGIGDSACRFDINDGTLSSYEDYLKFPVYEQSDYKDYNAFKAELRQMSASGGSVFRDESSAATASDKAIYIIDDKKYYCQQKDAGCSAMGQPEIYKNTGAATVYYKNTPDNYSKILCTAEGQGCESWTSAKGVDYFKIPKKECEYKDASGSTTGGWYAKGTDTACYSGFIKNSAYGIWRNADANFNGSAGLCPETQSGCTEFVDPLDTSSANPKGQPYYLLDNDKLKSLQNDRTCSGKVSLTQGCVLLDKTSEINKKYNSLATYFAADQQKKLVAPVDKSSFCGIFPAVFGVAVNPFKPCSKDNECPTALTQVFPGIIAPVYTGKCEKIKLDTNTILKVTRDRECSEWLACKSSYSAYDPITGRAKIICTEMGLCDKYQSTGTGSSVCANFVAKNPDSGIILSADYYSKRPVGWVSKDYSGFSLGNKYPVLDAKTKDVDSTDAKDLRLCVGDCDTPIPSGTIKGDQNMDGTQLTASSGEKSVCRGYPEQDSPFPSAVAQYDMQGFKNANTCESGKNCECDYTKLTYSNKATVKYTEYGNRSVATGICQGGSRDGESCKPGVSYDEDVKLSCGSSDQGGTCLKLQRQDDVIGWSGYCLERDYGTPINGDKNQKACLTWLPQDIASGQRDIYNQYQTAGYVPPLGGGKYYCMQATGNYSDSTKSYVNPLMTALDACTCTEGITPVGGCYGSALGGEARVCTVAYDELKTTILGIFTGDAAKANNAFLAKYGWVKGTIASLKVAELWGATNTANTLGNRIYKDEIDYIKIKFVNSVLPKDGDTIHPYPGTVFYIKPTQKTTTYSGFGDLCDGVKKTDNCSGENDEGNATGKLRDSSQKAQSSITDTAWYFRYIDQDGSTIRDYLSTDLFAVTQDLGGYCADNTQPKSQSFNAFQLKFNFDKTSGLLTGAQIAACSGYWDNRNRFILELSVKKRETCELVADTAAFKNQAYTDRLWAYNNENIYEMKPTLIGMSSVSLPYHYNYEIQPFGSSSANLSPKDQGAWYSYYSVGTPNFAGVPWACRGSCGTPLKTDKDATTVDFDSKTKSAVISSSILTGNNTINPRNYLSYLFSKIFSVFSLKDTNRTYGPASCDSANPPDDCMMIVPKEEIRKFPRIFSFDASKKLPNGQYRLAQENKFLINNQSGDVYITGNQYPAVMRFYFWADTNHMPVRSIKVNWGDGSVTETIDGLYKNHKPLCAKTNTEWPLVCVFTDPLSGIVMDSGILCPADKVCPLVTNIETNGVNVNVASKVQTCLGKKLFGNSPDACDEAFFELQHTFVCAKPSGQICTFAPTVVITDNWGIDNTFIGKLISSDDQLKAASGKLNPGATGPKIILAP